MMIKRNEFRDKEMQDEFLRGMPPKVAKALKHLMDVAKPREFADLDIRKGKLYYVDKNRLQNPRLRLVVPMRMRARVLTANTTLARPATRGSTRHMRLCSVCTTGLECMRTRNRRWRAARDAQKERSTIAGHGTAQHQGLMPMKFR
jgi:hypothetical protein